LAVSCETCVHVTVVLRGERRMKQGYEGITISLWMLVIAWACVAIVKFFL
jgi:hypothetical protein